MSSTFIIAEIIFFFIFLKGMSYRMERVFEIIEEQLHLTGVEITEDSTFKDDLGADSIDLVELVMAFEDEFGVEVSYEELEKKVKTVGDAIEFLREQGADI